MECGDKPAKYKYAGINISSHLAILSQIARDPIARKLDERQIVLLDEIFITTPYAFWLWDLPNVTIVVEYLLNKVEEDATFNEYILKFLELFAIPPLLYRSSDTLLGARNLDEYFCFFAYILVTSNEMTYKNLVIKALYNILLRKHQLIRRSASLQFCHESIERSTLPELVANLMEITENDFYDELLGISYEFAKISTKTCIKMLKEDALITILTRLNPNRKINPATFVTFHTPPEEHKNLDVTLELAEIFLRTLADIPEHERTSLYPLGIKTLHSLRYILRVAVLKGKKIRRNFLFSLILKIMDLYPNEVMVQSGLIPDIILLATASEMGTAGTWATAFKFTDDKEDFEFLKMLLVSVYYCTKYLGGDYFIKQNCVILAMLKLIAPEYKSKWCPDHLCVLKHYTLTILERIVPQYVDEFMQYKGLIRTLILIDFYTACDYDLNILIAALKVIKVTLTAKHDQRTMLYCVKIQICRQIQDLIYLILENEFLTSQNQEAIQYGLDILTILTYSMEVTLFRTVELIEGIFQRVLHPQEMDIGYELKMMISAIVCLSTLCVSNDDFGTDFSDMNGIFMLLDLIKDAKFALKVVALGFLVILCEEGGAIPYLLSWRNKGMTFQQMLLSIFREENELIGVKTEDDGIISGYSCPLMGKLQRLQMEKQTNVILSPAISDMNCSCRPKIYALIKLLEVRFAPQTEVANDYYKIYNYNLTLEDRLTKIMVENFLTLKMAETWTELSILQKNNNFVPVSFDQEMMTQMLKTTAKWCENMYNLQRDLKATQLRNEIISEAEFYELLRESKLGNALEALKEIYYIARTTEQIFHLTKRMKDNLAISDLTTSTHRTLNPIIGLSWIKNQKIHIESDKNDMDVEALPLASPIPEEVRLSNIWSCSNSTISLDLTLGCDEKTDDKR